MAEILIQHGNSSHLQQVQQWLENADLLMDETLSKERKGRHNYLRGFLAYRLGSRKGDQLFQKITQGLHAS